ncbi:hypothetical protein IHE44_0011830 [Lamprotornis superbus]|uniref:NIDO domain-containing protein n=1 Tax=Lamprotornis superbus TaxID=245042 RepID=A0A835ND44_9PASS|nr:hypothetical protein IHE44_0011830 [Lamprotornis superbus]
MTGVNNNGVVSFGTMVPEFTPQPFPLPGHRPFVAPYWADVDTRLGGDVFYRQSRDPQLLARLAQDLAPAVPPGDPSPQPTWAFVATWDRVAYFGAASDKVNTFQAVLASDGVTCFVLLNYGDLQWTTGIANQGDPHTGLGGIPAQAGFNSGDDVHYYNVPGSRTHAVQSLSHRSNMGVPGRWAFRVDHFEATEGPPETPGTLSKTSEDSWSPLASHKTPSVSPNPPRTTEDQIFGDDKDTLPSTTTDTVRGESLLHPSPTWAIAITPALFDCAGPALPTAPKIMGLRVGIVSGQNIDRAGADASTTVSASSRGVGSRVEACVPSMGVLCVHQQYGSLGLFQSQLLM